MTFERTPSLNSMFAMSPLHDLRCMQFEFYKYQACGNDFVLIDLLTQENSWVEAALAFQFWKDEEAMRMCCDRKFGIGADGILIMLPAVQATEDGNGNPAASSFMLLYLNADGKEGSLCGNGSRCAAAHAFRKGYFQGSQGKFSTNDAMYCARLASDGHIALEMKDPLEWRVLEIGTFLHTGSPHLVIPVRDLVNYPVEREGKALRFHSLFVPEGTNVNFMEVIDTNNLKVRTYERGVEAETLSCGTGAVACALLHVQQNSSEFDQNQVEIQLQFRGGALKVRGSIESSGILQKIELIGPAHCSYKGLWISSPSKTYAW